MIARFASRFLTAEWLLGAAGLLLAWRFLLPQFTDVARTYFFSEYALKVVPFFTDAAGRDLIDTWALGDPRPRVVTLAAQFLNSTFRAAFPDLVAWHPGIGLSWVLYPLVVREVNLAARMLGGGRLLAGSAALLWACSPPALDSLVLCYLPAKALMNLWFALAIRLAATALVSMQRDGPLARRPLLLLGLVVLLALLTDETAAALVVGVLIMFWPLFRLPFNRPGVTRLGQALLLPGICFGLITFAIFPLANRVAGQVPLSYLELMLHGPSSAMTGFQQTAIPASAHFQDIAGKMNPLYLGFVVATAHLLPFRAVPGFWTSGRAVNLPEWPLQEVALVVLAFAVLVALIARLPPSWKDVSIRCGLALLGLLLVYSLLLVPLAPAILEINYYGALFSLPLALLAAIALCGGVQTSAARIGAVMGVTCLAALQATGYEATSRRTQAFFADGGLTSGHPTGPAWNRASARAIKRAVDEGRFAEIVQQHVFPSPGFCFAFELEAGRENRAARRFDYVPGQPADRPFGVMLAQQREWLRHLGITLDPLSVTLATITTAAPGATPVAPESWPALIHGTAWHGRGDDWEFTRTFDAQGGFVERYWLRSVTRIWRQIGSAVAATGDTRLSLTGTRYNNADIHTIYITPDGEYLAFAQDGRCHLRFRLIAPTAL